MSTVLLINLTVEEEEEVAVVVAQVEEEQAVDGARVLEVGQCLSIDISSMPRTLRTWSWLLEVGQCLSIDISSMPRTLLQTWSSGFCPEKTRFHTAFLRRVGQDLCDPPDLTVSCTC
jgi:hypothetical protein